MIKLIRKSYDSGNVIAEYTCSAKADVTNLPTPPNGGIDAGSTCICTEDKTIHMLGADNVWHQI